MAPVVPLSVNPAGSAPTVMDQVKGEVPPEAVRVTPAYEAFTVPLGRVGALVMLGPPIIFNEKARLAEPCRVSVTCTVKLCGPAVFEAGVPLIRPVLVFRMSPCGSDVLLIRAHV